MFTKTRILLLSALFVLVTIVAASAQSKLIIRAKGNIKQLQLLDKTSGKLTNVPNWNKSGGGFLVEVTDLNQMHIVSQGVTELQIYRLDKKVSTTWIELWDGQSISLQNCFDTYTDKNATSSDAASQNANNFFTTNFTGYSLSGSNTIVRGDNKLMFTDKNHGEITKPEDLRIEWTKQGELEKIYLRDVTTDEVIWVTSNYFTQDMIDFSTITSQLPSNPFKMGHEYELKIYLKGAKTDYEYFFAINPVVFELKNSTSFLSVNDLQINWVNASSPQHIKIVNDRGQVVYKAQYFPQNMLQAADIVTVPDASKSGKYKLLVESGGVECAFQYEIVADMQELDALKQFIGN